MIYNSIQHQVNTTDSEQLFSDNLLFLCWIISNIILLIFAVILFIYNIYCKKKDNPYKLNFSRSQSKNEDSNNINADNTLPINYRNTIVDSNTIAKKSKNAAL